MTRWLREDTLNISLAAGEIASAAALVGPIHNDGKMTPADIIAVLMLSSHIDGWNWRRAVADGTVIAEDMIVRITA